MKTIGLDLDGTALLACSLNGARFRVGVTLVEVKVGAYGNGRLAIQLVCAHDEALEERARVRSTVSMLSGRGSTGAPATYSPGMAFATLTVNLVEDSHEDGEVFIKTWGGNERLVVDALKSDLFEDTGRRVPVGSYDAIAHVWRIRR